MSYKRRKAKIHQAQQHEFYEAPSGQMQAWSGEIDLDYTAPYPGPREDRTVDAANYSTGTFDPGTIRDNVDWSIGGIPGLTKSVGSVGVTDPQTVDAHDFRGQMAVVRRMADTNYGPVKTADHNSILSLLYQMAETNSYFPNEVSQADLIRAV